MDGFCVLRLELVQFQNEIDDVLMCYPRLSAVISLSVPIVCGGI